ncbi:MAG TPA: hypothetical protein VGF98_14685 [Candidatus Tumulicola sp.]|jgi:hypothetical protein
MYFADDFFAADFKEDPTSILVRFVQDIEQFIDDLIYGETLLKRKFVFRPARLKQLFISAWDELTKSGYIKDFIRVIENKCTKEVQRDYGLEGEQLKLKMSLIHDRVQKFLDSGTAAALVKALDAVDALLDSLVLAVGFGDALKELKQSFGLCVTR